MERITPVRKTHTSTADLLTWSETPPPAYPPSPNSASSRSHKPSCGISPALFGGPMTEEEVESANKRKPCSGPKLKEMTGSGIFATDVENGVPEFGSSLTNTGRTGVRIYQQVTTGISQISFNAEESVSPKKPTSLPEVAKQRELSGTIESESDDAKVKIQISDAKNKELNGHDIFGPPPEIPLRPLAARYLELKGQLDFGESTPHRMHTSVKPSGGQDRCGEESAAKKIHNQKMQELTGNDIFKGETSPASTEKPLSSAKLKEMSGSDIFADAKAAAPRDYFGGVRKPPGGESTISLV